MKLLLLSDTHFGITHKTYRIWDKYWKEHLAPLQFDAILLAGDIGTASLRHYEAGLRFFRSRTSKPIIAVRGNHDLWDSTRKDIYNILRRTRELAEKHSVHLLQDHGPITLGDIDFVGWDGWYVEDPSGFSNDFNWMPEYTTSNKLVATHNYLSALAHSSFGSVLEYVREHLSGRVFVMSHMPCVPGLGDGWRNANRRYGDFLVQLRVPYMLFGHTHLRLDANISSTRILSVGSDYNKPNHMLLDTDEKEEPSGSSQEVL